MRPFIWILALCLASTASLHARLGETWRECELRYQGIVPDHLNATHPLVPGAQHVTFVIKGWRIRVAFVSNRAVAEEYRKDLSHPDGAVIKPVEMESILEAEKGDGAWTAFKGDFSLDPSKVMHQTLINATSHRWHRTDGATAESIVNLSFLLQTPAALRAIETQKKQAAQAQKARIPKF